MKAIIIEDSRLARVELKSMLEKHPTIEIIAEAENGSQGKELIETHQPDLVFLDINMPSKNGFEMLESLDYIPTVIFTTAYDEYAIKSFEYNAFDYLLKPIKPERLAKTIEKIQNLQSTKFDGNNKKLNASSQVFVRDGEKCWIIKLEEIRVFEICGNYSRVYFKEFKPLILKSLNQLEERLDDNTFFRANRQQIINLDKIKNVEPWFNGRIKLWLGEANQEVEVSRRQSVKLKEILSL